MSLHAIAAIAQAAAVARCADGAEMSIAADGDSPERQAVAKASATWAADALEDCRRLLKKAGTLDEFNDYLDERKAWHVTHGATEAEALANALASALDWAKDARSAAQS